MWIKTNYPASILDLTQVQIDLAPKGLMSSWARRRSLHMAPFLPMIMPFGWSFFAVDGGVHVEDLVVPLGKSGELHALHEGSPDPAESTIPQNLRHDLALGLVGNQCPRGRAAAPPAKNPAST
jgi:hypothetical protein